MAQDLFPKFDRIDPVYKTLSGVDFPVAVLKPKSSSSNANNNAQQKKRPLLVHFHGGAHITGTYLEPAFTPKWVLELALSTNAILVSPAYRLIPEATGGDIMDDLSDFWYWIHDDSLSSHIANAWPGESQGNEVHLDLNHIAAVGESAGGLLALQFTFLFSNFNKPGVRIRAVMAQYPSLYPDISAQPPHVPGGPHNEFIDEYIRNIKPGTVRVSSPWPAMLEFLDHMDAVKRYRALLGDDERLKLGNALRFFIDNIMVAAATLGSAGVDPMALVPGFWVLQGEKDHLVSCVCTLYAENRFRSPFSTGEPGT